MEATSLRSRDFNRTFTPYYGDAWPTFSPDGKWIAVFIGEEGRYGDYWVMPSTGGAPRRLTKDFEEGGAPAWTPDGKFLVVPSARAGSVNLWRVSVAGGVPEALTTGPGEDLDPVVSPDGRTVLFANVKRTWAVVVHDVKSGVRRTLIEKRTPLVFPTYSPDGRRIALAGKNARGDTHLFVMNADGSSLDGRHGRRRRNQHHAEVGDRWRDALFLPGASPADVSKHFCLGRCVARNCPLVAGAPTYGSSGPSRAHRCLFSDRPGRSAALANARSRHRARDHASLCPV